MTRQYGLYQQDGQQKQKGEYTIMAIKEIIIDPKNPPPLTAEQKKMATKLANMPDSEIDLSDIPEADDKGWKRENPFFTPENYRPKKKLVSIRIDGDVLDWLKSTGKGYQTRVNELLRQEMMKSL